MGNSRHSLLDRANALSGSTLKSYHDLELPTGKKNVTIFVDSETQSQPSMSNRGPNGEGNVILTNIDLGEIGALHRIFYLSGKLSRI